MQEKLIDFNTAVLAKEKGFNWNVRATFNTKFKDNSIPCINTSLTNWNINDDMFKRYVSAPTQSLLQKWLREKHDKYITLTFIRVGEADSSYTVDIYCWRKWKSYKIKNIPDFVTYEEALEVGLFNGLKLIKDE